MASKISEICLLSMEIKVKNIWMILSASSLEKLQESFAILCPYTEFNESLVQKTTIKKRL